MEINETNKTRLSIDFRIIIKKEYKPVHDNLSSSKNKKFILGEYYTNI